LTSAERVNTFIKRSFKTNVYPRMPELSHVDRRTRILDAAEQVFADHGFEGASLRRIVQEARVNLATVYYYFHSKEGLMAAVLERRFGPLRQEHLEQLEQLHQDASGQPLPVETIVEAMLRPPLRLAVASSDKHQSVMRLIGRIVTEPNLTAQEVLFRQHQEVRAAYLAALRRSLPDIPITELSWRIEFFWGALASALCNPSRVAKATGGRCNPVDVTTLKAQMLIFFSAGFRAPKVASQKKK
jgi:AcrR family transcriptional regulator